jgi:hypothetical protein
MGAELQGASLDDAKLQGASLDEAELQGASVDGAQLQGASLVDAELQGASVDGAQLQGASLDSAQLQGASLNLAALEAADLFEAHLWRTNPLLGPGVVSTVRMSGENWLPDDKAYQALRTTLESLPPGGLRDAALKRIQRLNGSISEPMLASCVPSADPPTEAGKWRKTLEAARVDEQTYRKALAKTLKELVCSGGDAIHVLRGTGFQIRLVAAGASAIGLIGELANKESKDCPVAASLTDPERGGFCRSNGRSRRPKRARAKSGCCRLRGRAAARRGDPGVIGCPAIPGLLRPPRVEPAGS